MTEAELDDAVRQLAELYGWMRYHTYRSTRSPAGFPDLVLVRERILYRELKRDDGKLTVEQQRWGAALMAAGGDFAVWRPRDLDAIASELARR